MAREDGPACAIEVERLAVVMAAANGVDWRSLAHDARQAYRRASNGALVYLSPRLRAEEEAV